MPPKLFRDKEAFAQYRLRILNTLSCFTTSAITETLYHYLGVVNVAPEDRKYIKMKNEFYMDRVIITHAKKSYIGLQLRQEAHIFNPPKLDVKGVNFFKSTAAESTSEFIYQEILMGQLLRPEDGKLKLGRIMKTIHNFQDKMADEIKSGNVGYLKRSIRVKSADAYANPLSNGAYKAVYVWNKVSDDKDRIDLPATVTLVKVNLAKKSDVAALEQWPKLYKRMLQLFEDDPEIGIVQDADDPDVKSKGKGIKAIAIPSDMDIVPDWLLAIIDVETLVGDNMKLLTQLYKPLGLTPGTSRHNGNSIVYYTNVVRI